jgi:hypothetical protein
MRKMSEKLWKKYKNRKEKIFLVYFLILGKLAYTDKNT